MKTLGLESCQAGWLAVSVAQETAGYWLLASDKEFEDILEKYDRIFLDVPIGLEDDVYVRECDQLLQKRLGPYYENSIFSAPIRSALYAPTYGEASLISYEATKKKVSTQAWNVIPDIRLVNRLIDRHKSFRDKLFESHPELLFQILNGHNTILQKKETKKGLRHRLGLLKKVNSFADDFFRNIKEEYRRNQVEEDDILNALALAVFSLRSVDHKIRTIPEVPELDSLGLPKAIHYA
jgi:predicted RNase H-like nuclease